MTEKEKKDKRTGMMVSGGIHALLLLLFLFLVAWREPNPPLPEYGIELNFGFQEAGSGNVEREEDTQVEETETVESEESEEPIEEEVIDDPVEEVVEETVEETTETPPPVEESTEETEVVEKVEEVQEENNEVTAEEEKKEEVEEKKEETPPVEETEDPPVEEKKEEEKPKPKPKPTIDQRGLLGKKKNDNSNASDNEGDDPSKKGNQGDPEGSLDDRGLMRGGGQGGPVLELTGWDWDRRPDVKDDSDNTGKIVFQIRIDDRGQVVRVFSIESTVPPAIVNIYRKELEKATFKALASNTRPAAFSEGKVTFIITSK